MPLLHITPGQVDVQLGRTLSRMSQDLLEYGRGATRLDPEGSCGVAEEVRGYRRISPKGKKKAEAKGKGKKKKK